METYKKIFKLIALIWIIVGILWAYDGVDTYVKCLSMQQKPGVLINFIVAPETLMKDIFLGVSMIIIGIRLFLKSKEVYVELVSIILWMILFDIYTISFNGFDKYFFEALWSEIISYIPFFALVYLTFLLLIRIGVVDENVTIKKILQENTVLIIVEVVVFSLIGFKLIRMLPVS